MCQGLAEAATWAGVWPPVVTGVVMPVKVVAVLELGLETLELEALVLELALELETLELEALVLALALGLETLVHPEAHH